MTHLIPLISRAQFNKMYCSSVQLHPNLAYFTH